MENNKKQFDREKLSAFLLKVITKLGEGAENIGADNDKVLANWLEDVQPKEESGKSIEVDVNQMLLAGQNEESKVYDEIVVQCGVLFDPIPTIPQKEEVFAKITNCLLNDENILSDKVSIQKVEQFMTSLIVAKEEIKSERYTNELTTSIKVMSVLMKKIVVLEQKEKSIPYVLMAYCNEFANSFSRLVYYPDYRLRLCISHAIGNIIAYMLRESYEEKINAILSICYNDIFTGFDKQIAKHHSFSSDNSSSLKEQKPNKEDTKEEVSINKDNSMSLESTKSILLEALAHLAIEVDQCKKCQYSLIESMNKVCSCIDNDNIISILLIVYELLFAHLAIPFYRALVKASVSLGDKASIPFDFKQVLLNKASYHLALPNPRLRFVIIKFLSEFNKVFSLKTDQFFTAHILPKICLNRYLPVDGVQKQSMALWKEIVDMSGIDIIKANYEAFLTVYVSELYSQGQEAREAACRCIQELIMKVYKDEHRPVIEKYSFKMLEGVIGCCKHACWNVRETGLVAIGYVYSNLKQFLSEDSKRMVNDIIKYHCFDNIIEARDASAFALKTMLSNNDNHIDEQYETFYAFLIQSLNDRAEMDKLLNAFKKEAIAYATSNQDLAFMREIDIVDFRDCAMHVIKELAEAPSCFLFVKKGMKVCGLAMSVIDFFCKDYSVLTNLSKKTIWETLAVLFSKMTKDEVDMHLDYVIDLLVKDISEHRNSLCGFQAEKFITGLAQGANKRMIKGKMKNKVKGNEALTKLFEKILQ